ncbi:SAM-dependent methyltransferase [Desulfuribacillus stibiiarsenatis]|uniref:SAM-dependent methyltransferase n=1 Tax=Desulfuribacillus stibiiarsenatis TaxID=1390249 RepID=A0A1E5L8I5_9FIRM|nr:class I SAM-dependent methyltransferase [Desulfuribacillus stibiiarsenatis]OEH86455.1 SAM-dependent methyltransferase [Desulfuribacillus stibiiarsenatis]
MLELTEERVVPKLMKPTNGMLLEHLARYYFATPYIYGRVLDIACGAGYGCHMIAKERKREVTEVIGVDIDPITIRYANREYNHPKIEFRVGDCTDPNLPEQLGMFETIISFETVEHIEDDQQFIENVYQMLSPGGKFIISSPFGQGRGKPTTEPFHVHQLTQQEFEELFTAFSSVEFYYQRGVTFEKTQREGVKYYIGMAVCTK